MSLEPNQFQTERHDIRSYDVANPIVGNAFSVVPVSNHVIQVLAVSFTLTTSVAVADRVVHCFVETSGAAPDAQYSAAPVAQAESLTRVYHFTMGIGPLDHGTDAGVVLAPLCCCCQLKSGNKLTFTAWNLQATDALSNISYRCADWLED